MTTTPDKLLLRRSEAIALLDITEYQFAKLEGAGTVVGKPLHKGGRKYFHRDALRALLSTFSDGVHAVTHSNS